MEIVFVERPRSKLIITCLLLTIRPANLQYDPFFSFYPDHPYYPVQVPVMVPPVPEMVPPVPVMVPPVPEMVPPVPVPVEPPVSFAVMDPIVVPDFERRDPELCRPKPCVPKPIVTRKPTYVVPAIPPNCTLPPRPPHCPPCPPCYCVVTCVAVYSFVAYAYPQCYPIG